MPESGICPKCFKIKELHAVTIPVIFSVSMFDIIRVCRGCSIDIEALFGFIQLELKRRRDAEDTYNQGKIAAEVDRTTGELIGRAGEHRSPDETAAPEPGKSPETTKAPVVRRKVP